MTHAKGGSGLVAIGLLLLFTLLTVLQGAWMMRRPAQVARFVFRYSSPLGLWRKPESSNQDIHPWLMVWIRLGGVLSLLIAFYIAMLIFDIVLPR